LIVHNGTNSPKKSAASFAQIAVREGGERRGADAGLNPLLFPQQDIGEKVLERLATSDKTTIVIERQPDGKIRVASGSWGGREDIFAG
jgi:hypothetical protein